MGGSVSRASDFGSGHDLMVCEFQPCVGFAAVSPEPASGPSARPLPSLLTHSLSKNKKIKPTKTFLPFYWSRVYVYYFFLSLFIWERESERERVPRCVHVHRGGAERGRGVPSRLCTVSARTPTQAWTHEPCEFMTWAKIKSQMLNRLSHLGASGSIVYI